MCESNLPLACPVPLCERARGKFHWGGGARECRGEVQLGSHNACKSPSDIFDSLTIVPIWPMRFRENDSECVPAERLMGDLHASKLFAASRHWETFDVMHACTVTTVRSCTSCSTRLNYVRAIIHGRYIACICMYSAYIRWTLIGQSSCLLPVAY